ncbi:MAG: nucleotide exchange factor GrpE [Clostridia bacterium]|nr:nucleotide exchange factor GrpE [Clostridia bacterium]
MQENKINEEVTEETVTVKEETTAKNEKCDKKKMKALEAELEEVKKQAEETNEKYLRMLAEYDNFRKRSAKERESIYGDAYTDALTAILPVLDNLERAESCSDADGLSKGLELTLKSFRETLEKMGVKEIEAVGQTFDPNLHNAVFHVEDENYGENEIVEVLMKGYIKGDKVIRYSMVKVAN